MKKIFVLLYLLVELSVLGSFSPGECGESQQTACYHQPDCLVAYIKYYGPRCVVKDLAEDDELEMFVMHKIGEGSSEWLEIANLLRPGSDAGITRDLNLAVGEALENNPKNVFTISLKAFEIIDICRAPESSLELGTRLLEKRIKNVKSIKDKKLTKLCDECINYLEKAKDNLKRFYEN